MNEKVRKIILIAGILIVLGGIIGLLYPFVGNYINSLHHASAVQDYKEDVANLDEEQAENFLNAARLYNQKLFARCEKIVNLTDEEQKDYYNILSISNTSIMGYLEIPKLKLLLPIYHGTSDDVLQSGVGHLEGSSFPIDGTNIHAVLTSHSGLPSTELFTNLDKLEKGDTFSVTILNRTVTYEVFDKYVSLPYEIELMFEEGSNYCTLITCTPVGVNSHRLVVRAKEI